MLRRYAVKIPVTSGFDVLHVPDATREVFQQHLNSFNDWSLVSRFVCEQEILDHSPRIQCFNTVGWVTGRDLVCKN